MEIRARRPADLVGTVSHRPFPGRPGEAGTARGTRALPGGSGLGPLMEIRASRPADLVGTERRGGRPGRQGELVALVAAPARGFADFNRTAGRVHEECLDRITSKAIETRVWSQHAQDLG